MTAREGTGISDWCSLQYIEIDFLAFLGQLYKTKPENWCSLCYFPNTLPDDRKYTKIVLTISTKIRILP